MSTRKFPEVSLFWHLYPEAKPQPDRTILIYTPPLKTRPHDCGSFFVGYIKEDKKGNPVLFDWHSPEEIKQIKRLQKFFWSYLENGNL